MRLPLQQLLTNTCVRTVGEKLAPLQLLNIDNLISFQSNISDSSPPFNNAHPCKNFGGARDLQALTAPNVRTINPAARISLLGAFRLVQALGIHPKTPYQSFIST
ncbi:uncharacterized protein CLUP02_12096 [Colletotrichum lupini]|uniref:Uncharacterized protein n=1 Tax=Colletotrichum lupini TaxID=145971 RepID=A0A9Q8SZP3_9PEZI|nr:uncharacterized protein CLUP02_12096 [Colletotrichum lupini]UQC86594.1 hypothetical protein CLUP02_12096 [Colletotrichum lupini]